MSVKTTILQLLPSGVSVKDIHSPRQTVNRALRRLVDEGIAFKGGDHHGVRWFDTREKANAYRAPRSVYVKRARPIPMQHKKATPAEAPAFVIKTRSRAGWEPDAPMVITANTKYTIAPTPPQPSRTNTHGVHG